MPRRRFVWPAGKSRAVGWITRSWSLLLTVGTAILFAVLVYQGTSRNWVMYALYYVLTRVLAEVLVRVCIALWVRSKRHLAQDGLRAQELDTRPPVLYLRSFSVDKLTARTGRRGAAMVRTEEEQLTRAFRGFGPVLAIGQPGEPLPMAGAAKLQVDGTEWQDAVLELIGKAGLVLIGAGTSPGLLWEIDQVVRLIPPERIVIFIPFGKEAYDHFRARTAAHFGRMLPPWAEGTRASAAGIRAAIYFRPDWEAYLVRLDVDRRLTLEKSCYKYLNSVYGENGVARPGFPEPDSAQAAGSAPLAPLARPAPQAPPPGPEPRRRLPRPRSAGGKFALSILAGLTGLLLTRAVVTSAGHAIFHPPAPVAFPAPAVAGSSTTPGTSPAAALDAPETSGVAFSPSGRILATVNYFGTADLWNLADPGRAAVLRPPARSKDYFSGAAFSPAGTILAVGNANGSAYLWNAGTRRLIGVVRDPDSRGVRSVAFSPNGRILATGDGNGNAYLWDVAARRLIGVVRDSAGRGVRSVAFSPGGGTLATGDLNGRAYLWRVATRRLVTTMSAAGDDGIYSVAFSPDGRTLAAGDADGSAYLWRVATGSLTAVLSDPKSWGVYSVAFSPDGKTLATGEYMIIGADLWNLATHHLRATVTMTTGSEFGLAAVAFSPDGRLLATGETLGTYLWDPSRLGH